MFNILLFKENAYVLMPNEVTVSLPDCGIKELFDVTDSLLDVTSNNFGVTKKRALYADNPEALFMTLILWHFLLVVSLKDYL